MKLKLLIKIYMICFICRDTFDSGYKICTCKDSTICNDCIELYQENQITKCGVCRSNLDIKYQYQYFNILINLLYLFIPYILIFGIPLIFPIYYFNELDLTYILILTLFCILILDYINYKFCKYFFNYNYTYYQTTKILIMIPIYIIISFINNLTFKFIIYLLGIIFSMYIIPNICFAFYLIYINIKNVLNNINSLSTTIYIYYNTHHFHIISNSIEI